MPSSTASKKQHEDLMNWFLKGVDFTPPTNLWVALYTTAPATDGTGGVEVNSSLGYSRIAIPRAQGSGSSQGWQGPTGVNYEYSNFLEIVFGAPTGNWGTIVGAALMDAQTGGNLRYWAALTTPKTVNNGDGAPRILSGQLKIQRATC